MKQVVQAMMKSALKIQQVNCPLSFFLSSLEHSSESFLVMFVTGNVEAASARCSGRVIFRWSVLLHQVPYLLFIHLLIFIL